MNEINNNQSNHNPVVNFLKKFISFDSMITPSIITFLFWLMIIIIFISGFVTIIGSFGYYYGVNQLQIIYGILYIIIGSLSAKVFCEILIVLFKINENLKEIAKNTRK
ncbi:DUF4282 domain-containing protein [Francisella tularensis subsp. novicida]|uniref:DUF4282 domain-containing protein n=2 Tax=Francisella tularensis TaxID=263 RepID=A0A6I4RVI9_FRATU|nr:MULTISPECIES: DUF4282 domain-containing protein [Francisella]ABK89220.1 hypothetical protein FTN_0314 [Francisella tularensis subsp. novicida U112]AJI60869.1 hypothetical protein AW25_1727 [Francisella tularensis subsp. novicida U112]APA82353.1 hypothetical protein N894_0369 [Francisella tularensis subsp. novicida PA10-7858]APC95313.1 hypothetical protein KX02_290 [Francisella tularensis subsp. novicida]EDX19082.1 conserved hypothetical protein [Francisella tularensis subsp. novicida FTE]